MGIVLAAPGTPLGPPCSSGGAEWPGGQEAIQVILSV